MIHQKPVRASAVFLIALAATQVQAQGYGDYYTAEPLAPTTPTTYKSFDGENSPLGPACGCVEASPACGCAAPSTDGGCATGCCSCKQKKAAQAKAAGAYKGVFYANDYSYINDPCYDDCLLGDCLKQHPVGCEGMLDVGGQLRLRYHHEEGMNKGAPRFTQTTDDFLLTRLRLFANYKMHENVRFFVEGIYADSGGQDLPPRPIDVNQGDLLNLFVDLRAFDELTFRLGRQELLYGAQRTVSPLDWANTRRTFEGIKAIWKQDDWQVDAFWTAFVPVKPFEFDQADWDQQFYGAYAVYDGYEDVTFDFYYLGYDDRNLDFALNTFGARANGSCCDWLYEFEGAFQTGDNAGVDQDAGFATIGVGRQLGGIPWSPTLWAYFDYASGDVPGGDQNGYNHLFPLAHKYLGFIDAVQRSNIESVNFLLTAKPSKKVNLLLWYYIFQSNQDGPVPAIGGTPAQGPSRDLGQELDMIVKYTINPRSDFLLGYSHFWAGDKILTEEDADFLYAQWTLNF